jgi:lipocalin
MSAAPFSGQQRNSGGTHYFLQYTDADGNYNATENISNVINSSGPIYADVDMTYISDDGKIKVLNSGHLNTLDGPYKESVGKAKARKNGMPGQLEVSFFGPFYGDYDILELAPDYSYSVVGSSSPKYLWILSRTPQLSTATKDKILLNLRHRGYDTSKLIWVKQK